ncbi:MAG: Rrf2 family transcriptional regulator [Myxococcota bacterium]
MKLTLHTDYALRMLIFLATRQEDGLAKTADVSEAYDISRHHLVKVTAELATRGYIESVPGRGGGIRLDRAPSEISVGAVVRDLEPSFALVECMEEDPQCVITPVCKLRSVLGLAMRDFLETLDDYTLADICENASELRAILTA